MRAKRWEIENFLTPEQCQGLIDYAEEQGFEVATLNTPTGNGRRLDYRNNDRLIFDNQALANELWQMIKDDSRLGNPGWEPVGLNERFKVYRYTGDQFFAMHYDGSFERVPFEEQS